MPTATLKFKLPDEQREFEAASKANELSTIVWDLKEEIRGWLSHGHKFKTPDEVLEHIVETLCDEINERGLSSIINN